MFLHIQKKMEKQVLRMCVKHLKQINKLQTKQKKNSAKK